MLQSPTEYFCRCLQLRLPTDYIRQYQTGSSEIFTVHVTITDGQTVGDYRCKYRRNYSVGKVLAGNIFFSARFAVYNSVGVLVFLFLTELATENEITDDQNFDGRVPSVWPSRNILPTKCVPYTDGMSLSVKLFIGVVFF